MRGRLVEMAGGTGRADVIDVFADHGEQGVTGPRRHQDTPPPQRRQTLGQDGKDGYAQESARPEADQGAKPLVRTAERGA